MWLPLLQQPSVASSSLFIRDISSLELSNLKTNKRHLALFPEKLRVPVRRFPQICSWTAARATSVEPPAQALRLLLESPGIHQGPVCHDALSAMLVERAGFPLAFMGGFAVSAARLGLPDVGLISYGEMLDQGYQISQAVSIPLIGDVDNGYGNPMNVKRTVKGFIRAGFAGIILDDQLSPKACGNTHGRRVVSREEALMTVRAALDSRRESGSDIVIVARTNARQAVSLEEALWRSNAFADAGADVLFIDALASVKEMKAFCQISPLSPKMANMLEGGGKTSILSPKELQEIGFKLVGYPLSLIGVSIRAMEEALIVIKSGQIPPQGSLPSFEEIKEILGFNEYYEEEDLYNISDALQSDGEASTIQERANQRGEGTINDTVELNSPSFDIIKSDYFHEPLYDIWSRNLRVKVTASTGLEKFDIRIPAGFLEGLSRIIPGMSEVNAAKMLYKAWSNGNPEKGQNLLDFKGASGERVEIFVE